MFNEYGELTQITHCKENQKLVLRFNFLGEIILSEPGMNKEVYRVRDENLTEVTELYV